MTRSRGARWSLIPGFVWPRRLTGDNPSPGRSRLGGRPPDDGEPPRSDAAASGQSVHSAENVHSRRQPGYPLFTLPVGSSAGSRQPDPRARLPLGRRGPSPLRGPRCECTPPGPRAARFHAQESRHWHRRVRPLPRSPATALHLSRRCPHSRCRNGTPTNVSRFSWKEEKNSVAICIQRILRATHFAG